MTIGWIINTDPFYDPDDGVALKLALNSPEMGVDLIVTGDEVEGKRARCTQTLLRALGRSDIRVMAGTDLGRNDFICDWLLDSAPNRVDPAGVAAIKDVVDTSDEVRYVGIDGFTDLSTYLTVYPEDAKKLRVYQMGGAIDFSRRPGWVEHNVKIDAPAARHILESGVDMALVMTQTTFNPAYAVGLDHPIYKQLAASDNMGDKIIARHFETWHKAKGLDSYMHDPLTVATAMGKKFVSFNETPLKMDERGNMAVAEHGRKVRWSRPESKDKEFMAFLEQRLFG